MSPRVGRELAARLGRGEKLTFRSIVKAETFPGEMETVHAVIPGDGSSTQAVAMSGHLYEGYLKQGANDDASGCAVTLEMGRALIRLVADGKLPRPKRDIHFLWVPEISGTTAWLNKHQDVAKRLVADLNFDMEGLALAASGSMFVMHRTPDTFPTWLNDVGESMIRFIAELNRERVRYRGTGYAFTLPVVSPTGSVDPLYYRDRQVLRRKRPRGLHGPGHSVADVHHVARQVLPLVARHAREARSHAVQARGGDRPGRR